MGDRTIPVEQENQREKNEIKLSETTSRLLEAIDALKPRQAADEYTKLIVSQTVSFLALVYEKVRNAIEYREEHLIRRAAVERILKRRFALNPHGHNEGKNLLRELLWARYFPNGSMGQYEVKKVQTLLNQYVALKKRVVVGRDIKHRKYLSDFLMDLYTAEIEEMLSSMQAALEANFTYYIFQTLRYKVQLEGEEEHTRDTFLFIAIEKAYRKSDRSYERYHLFRLYYKALNEHSDQEMDEFVTKFPSIANKIDELIANPTVDKLVRFTRTQLPPYLILFSIIRENRKHIAEILENRQQLWTKVEQTARQKYAHIRSRLNILAFRSLIYIFITKMLLALIIEVPVSEFLYHEVNYTAIGVNALAPPIFMLLIILTVAVPNDDNTKRIFLRICDIINADPSYEKSVALITKKVHHRRPILNFGFTLFYTITFIVTLYLIHMGLQMIHFNLLSEALFIFFISVVAFFAYRIKQVANIYRLNDRGTILTPVFDFFFMPILSLGKIFSDGISHINFFTVLFDFIIEAPFKLIIEVIEEWITFVRHKKEEIV